MTSVVVDASVAAKWLFPSKDEPLVDEAHQLLAHYVTGELRLIVPDLFWAEIGSYLWKSVRLGRCTETTARAALELLKERGFPTSPSLPLIEAAFGIATDFGRTVYDSLYVALAVISKAQLVTADEKLANALGRSLPVKWLGTARP